MSSSEDRLMDYVHAAAALRGVHLEEAWVPAVAQNLQRLLDAASALDSASLASEDLAPRFEP